MLRHRLLRAGSAAAAAAILASTLAAGTPALAVPDPAPTPSATEQYTIEILNRTRADPAAEAARFGIDLNEGLAPGTLTTEAREPLAVNFQLNAAARDHNADLFAHFTALPGDHLGSDGRDPTQRGTDAGASFIGGIAENNAWKTQSSVALNAASVEGLHLLLFKDFTSTFEVVGRGHRKVMLNGTRDEVGVAVTGGVFGGKVAAIVTQDLITTNRLHILGVAFADDVTNNQFYTPGEGLGGVTVKATDTSSHVETVTTTWGSGGYQIELPPGTYDVTASGPGLGPDQSAPGVVVTDRNVKVDFVIDHKVPVPPVPPAAAFSVTTAIATHGRGVKWTLAMTKAKLLVGRFTLPVAEADLLTIAVDGGVYFPPGDRSTSKVTRKLNATTGEVKKLTVKDKAGNTFTLDVGKGTFTLTLKKAPGLDPTDGTVSLLVSTPVFSASLTAPTKAVGKSGKQMKLVATTGVVAN